MKKRMLAILLAIAVCFSLAACGESETTSSNSRKKKSRKSSSRTESVAERDEENNGSEGNLPDEDRFGDFGTPQYGHPENAEEAIRQVEETFGVLGEHAEEKKKKRQEEFDQNNVTISGAVLEKPNLGRVAIKSYSITSGTFNPDDKIITFVLDYTCLDLDNDSCYGILANYINFYQDGKQLTVSYSSLDKEQLTYVRNGYSVEVIATFSLRNTTSPIEMECKDHQSVYSSYTLNI